MNLGFPACYVTFDGLEATPGTGTVAWVITWWLALSPLVIPAMSGYPQGLQGNQSAG